MFKKIASLVGAGAMLLSVSGVAFAHSNNNRRQMPSVDKNIANVTNTTTSYADTGVITSGNSAEVERASVRGDVEVGGNNKVTTGRANAESAGIVVANTQVGCSTCGGATIREDVANVTNSTGSQAYTGDVTVGNSVEVERASVGGRRGGEVEVSGNNRVVTGNANAQSLGLVVVNTQLSW